MYYRWNNYVLSNMRVIDLLVGRLSKKSCTLGCKHETWYNYGLRNACKHLKGTQDVGHCYDLFLGHFRSKKDIFGNFADNDLHGSW